MWDEHSGTRGYLDSDDVLVRAVFNQIVYPKVISVILHEVEFMIVVAGGSLEFFESL